MSKFDEIYGGMEGNWSGILEDWLNNMRMSDYLQSFAVSDLEHSSGASASYAPSYMRVDKSDVDWWNPFSWGSGKNILERGRWTITDAGDWKTSDELNEEWRGGGATGDPPSEGFDPTGGELDTLLSGYYDESNFGGGNSFEDLLGSFNQPQWNTDPSQFTVGDVGWYDIYNDNLSTSDPGYKTIQGDPTAGSSAGYRLGDPNSIMKELMLTLKDMYYGTKNIKGYYDEQKTLRKEGMSADISGSIADVKKSTQNISDKLIQSFKGQRVGAPTFSGDIMEGLTGSDISSSIIDRQINKQQSKNDILSSILEDEYQTASSEQRFMNQYDKVYDMLYGS